jgi:hypothetical protein
MERHADGVHPATAKEISHQRSTALAELEADARATNATKDKK